MGVQVPPRTLSSWFPDRLYRVLAVNASARAHACATYRTDRRIHGRTCRQNWARTRSTGRATPASLAFKTTADLPDLTEIIGQERAVSSVEFGMGIDSDGYNIFAVGPTGTGKTTTVYDFLKRRPPPCPAPDDWVYVYNFAQAAPAQRHPHAGRQGARVPQGHGEAGRGPAGGHHPGLRGRGVREAEARASPSRSASSRRPSSSALSEKAEAQGFTMVRTPAGLAFAPKGGRGRDHVARGVRGACRPRSRSASTTASRALNEELQQIMRLVRQDERGGRDALRELDQKVTDVRRQAPHRRGVRALVPARRDVRLPAGRAEGRRGERRRLQEVRRRSSP